MKIVRRQWRLAEVCAATACAGVGGARVEVREGLMI
jgi:hypothetical protein